ncbi:MAG: DUF6056 family protein [Ignavibacteria bacterium]
MQDKDQIINKRNDGLPVKIYITFAVITILSVIPFLLLNYYNQPTSEDFYYSGQLFNFGFSKAFRGLYKFWGGRYFGYILILVNPLCFNSITGYKFATFFMMLLYFVTIHFFISRFTRDSLNLSERLLLTLSIVFACLYSMPSIGQGFYWLISVLFYNVGIILSLLFLIVYSNQQKTINKSKKFLYMIPCVILLGALIGSCEIVGGTMFMILTALLIINFLKNRSLNYYTLIYLILCLIGVWIVNSAPGNVSRALQYPGNHDFLYSFTNALSFASVEFLKWTFITPLLFVTFLLLPVFKKMINDTSLNDVFKINPMIAFLLFSGLMVVNSFLIFWSIAEAPYGRILNFIYLIFIIGWFYNIVVFLYYIRNNFNLFTARIPNAAFGIALVLILAFGFKDNNIKTAYSDMFSGKASEYDKQLTERYEHIYNSNSDTVFVKSIINVPESFFQHDIYEKAETMYNEGYAKHFNRKTVLLKK